MELTRREITVLLQRDPNKDAQRDDGKLTGYNLCWPDGRLIGLGFENFCKIGMRYLFGRELPEWAKVSLFFYVLPSREAPLPRAKPHRLRVLCLRRVGRTLRMLLPDGSPTHIAFHLDNDDPAVLEWVGAADIPDGHQQWFGFLAVSQ